MSPKHSVGDIVIIKKGMKEEQEFRSEGGEEVRAGRLSQYGGYRAKIIRITITGTYKVELMGVHEHEEVKWTMTDEMIVDSSDIKRDRVDAIIDMM